MPKKDLTAIEGNLSSDIQIRYAELQTIADGIELTRVLIEMADARHKKGLSDTNYRKFRRDLDRCEQDYIEIVKYMTNYFMSGAGLSSRIGHKQQNSP